MDAASRDWRGRSASPARTLPLDAGSVRSVFKGRGDVRAGAAPRTVCAARHARDPGCRKSNSSAGVIRRLVPRIRRDCLHSRGHGASGGDTGNYGSTKSTLSLASEYDASGPLCCGHSLGGAVSCRRLRRPDGRRRHRSRTSGYPLRCRETRPSFPKERSRAFQLAVERVTLTSTR